MENISGENLTVLKSPTFIGIDLMKKGIQATDPVPGDVEKWPRVRNLSFKNVRVQDVPNWSPATNVPPARPVDGFTLADISGTCARAHFARQHDQCESFRQSESPDSTARWSPRNNVHRHGPRRHGGEIKPRRLFGWTTGVGRRMVGGVKLQDGLFLAEDWLQRQPAGIFRHYYEL